MKSLEILMGEIQNGDYNMQSNEELNALHSDLSYAMKADPSMEDDYDQIITLIEQIQAQEKALVLA